METNTLSTLVELLKHPNVSVESDTSKRLQRSPTLLDLSEEDRYRVLKLIEELVDNQETVDRLKLVLQEEKRESKERRNSLLRKLDVLSEKHERAQSDIQRLKQKHSHALKTLEEKISTVSQNFEKSVAESDELRKINQQLREENILLHKLTSDATQRLCNAQEENSRLSSTLEINKHQERAYRRHLRRLTSEMRTNSDTSNKANGYSLLTTTNNLERDQNTVNCHIRNCNGGGDFANLCNISSSTLTTIKPPAISGLEQRTESSSQTFANNSKPDSCPMSQLTTNHNDLTDMTILENLFFRF